MGPDVAVTCAGMTDSKRRKMEKAMAALGTMRYQYLTPYFKERDAANMGSACKMFLPVLHDLRNVSLTIGRRNLWEACVSGAFPLLERLEVWAPPDERVVRDVGVIVKQSPHLKSISLNCHGDFSLRRMGNMLRHAAVYCNDLEAVGIMSFRMHKDTRGAWEFLFRTCTIKQLMLSFADLDGETTGWLTEVLSSFHSLERMTFWVGVSLKEKRLLLESLLAHPRLTFVEFKSLHCTKVYTRGASGFVLK